MDPAIITRDWPSILALLAGLIVVKAAILTPIAKIGGNLSWEDSLRLGLVLSQGGEFAFVLLALANELGVLPSELNRLLIVVVVLSMALTPTLADVGKVASDAIKRLSPQPDPEPEGPCEPLLSPAEARACGTRPIVVCGAGPIGMAVATMLSSPLAEVEQMTRQAPGGGKRGLVILDYNPARLPPATALGFSTMMCGDTSGDILRCAPKS